MFTSSATDKLMDTQWRTKGQAENIMPPRRASLAWHRCNNVNLAHTLASIIQYAMANQKKISIKSDPSGSSLESSAERAVAKSETSALRGLAEPRSREIKLITMWPRTVSLLSLLCRCNSIF